MNSQIVNEKAKSLFPCISVIYQNGGSKGQSYEIYDHTGVLRGESYTHVWTVCFYQRKLAS